MALVGSGLWLENAATHHAVQYRQLLEGLVTGRAGVWPSTAVVRQTSGAERKVKVLSGRWFFLARSGGTHQGFSSGYNAGDTVLDIDASDAAQPRIDLVVIEQVDTATGGAGDLLRFRVITGTPNPSPAQPATPVDCLALAAVRVNAGVSVITDANITDLAPLVTATGGIIPCTSTTRPSGTILHAGLTIYETNTGRQLTWSGSAWVRGPWSTAAGASELRAGRIIPQSVPTSTVSAVGLVATSNADGWANPDGAGFGWAVPAGLGGLYAVDVSVAWASLLAGRAYIDLRFGASAVGIRRVAMPGEQIGGPSPRVRLAAGDILKIEVFQASGGAVNITAAELNAYRIGA